MDSDKNSRKKIFFVRGGKSWDFDNFWHFFKRAGAIGWCLVKKKGGEGTVAGWLAAWLRRSHSRARARKQARTPLGGESSEPKQASTGGET